MDYVTIDYLTMAYLPIVYLLPRRSSRDSVYRLHDTM